MDTPRPLYVAARPRIRERAAKSGHNSAQRIRGDSMGQVQKGWLLPPGDLHPDGTPMSWRSSGFNICFRLGVRQDDKLRACDDTNRYLANLSFTVSTPIQIVPWDHIAHLSHLISKNGVDWVLFKAGNEAAYRQRPIDPSGQRNAIVAPRHPTQHAWFGFAPRALLFGPIAAGMHYNVMSRILVDLANRCVGIPRVGYLGDFSAMIPKHLCECDLRVFAEFPELIGLHLKPAGPMVANAVVFRGLLGNFPPAASRPKHISLPGGNALNGPPLYPDICRMAGLHTSVWVISSADCLFHRPAYSASSPAQRCIRCIRSCAAVCILLGYQLRGGSPSDGGKPSSRISRP